MRVVAQEQTVLPPPTKTLDAWAGSRECEVTVVTTVQGWHVNLHEGDGKFAGVAGTYKSLIEPNNDPN